jgi:RNA polymerase sigma factor (sigma-70 family)
MANATSSPLLQFLRRIPVDPRGSTVPDQELLQRFLGGREEAAFAAILHRHGPMVLDVCRGVLANESDVEDAFQATFLVLAHRAASIRQWHTLGSWLHGVAYRTALKARAEAARRRHEAAVPPRQARDGDPATWAEARQLVHEELGRLSDRHREPLVLCYLQGKTQDEAARLLGLSKGTLKRRLERGRAVLRARLVRRGLGAPALLLLSAWPSARASGCVPPPWARAAVRSAVGVAGEDSVAVGASARVAALTEGVLRTMMLKTMLKTRVAAVLLAVVVAAAGWAVVTFATSAAEPRQPVPAARPALRGAQDRGKPKAEPRPVVIAEDAIIRQVAWGGGRIVATVGLNMEVVEFKDGSGGFVAPHNTIKLWDATTGKLLRSLGEEKHTNIMAIAFSPDGKMAAVSAVKFDEQDPRKGKAEIRVVEAASWALRHKIEIAGDGAVSALAFSPDGMRLALGGRSRLGEDAAFVRLWDVRKQKQLGRVEGGGYRACCLAFSCDGKLLAAGDEKGKVRLFDGLTCKARQVFEGHGQWVGGVGFSPDGKTLVSGSADKSVKLWDVEAGKLTRTLEGNKAPVTALAFSRDGRHFATVGGLKDAVEVLVWDTKTWEVRKSLPDQTVQVNALAFSPDGGTVALGGGNGIRLSSQEGRLHTPGELKLWKLK